MNRSIRRVGYAVTVLILLLVAQLTYLQVVDANNLANNPKNVRKQLKGYNPLDFVWSLKRAQWLRPQ